MLLEAQLLQELCMLFMYGLWVVEQVLAVRSCFLHSYILSFASLAV